jgi:hypothetical protein
MSEIVPATDNLVIRIDANTYPHTAEAVKLEICQLAKKHGLELGEVELRRGALAQPDDIRKDVENPD